MLASSLRAFAPLYSPLAPARDLSFFIPSSYPSFFSGRRKEDRSLTDHAIMREQPTRFFEVRAFEFARAAPAAPAQSGNCWPPLLLPHSFLQDLYILFRRPALSRYLINSAAFLCGMAHFAGRARTFLLFMGCREIQVVNAFTRAQ